MSDLITIYDRPTSPGYYRCQLNFDSPVSFSSLNARIMQMKGQIAIAGGPKAEFGVFAAKDAKGQLRPLDSTQPLDEWDFPEGSEWIPGGAIAEKGFYQYGGYYPDSRFVIVYINLKEALPLSPDGTKPKVTIVSKSQKTVLREKTAGGRVYQLPYQQGQRVLSAWPILARIGYWLLDVIIILAVAWVVFPKVASIAFNYLGKAAKSKTGLCIGGALALIGAGALIRRKG